MAPFNAPPPPPPLPLPLGSQKALHVFRRFYHTRSHTAIHNILPVRSICFCSGCTVRLTLLYPVGLPMQCTCYCRVNTTFIRLDSGITEAKQTHYNGSSTGDPKDRLREKKTRNKLTAVYVHDPVRAKHRTATATKTRTIFVSVVTCTFQINLCEAFSSLLDCIRLAVVTAVSPPPPWYSRSFSSRIGFSTPTAR